jgi:hypothetical protein
LQETKFLKMPLHRDIFWVGRRWAVTGYALQAVNRKRHGDFDIEASRIWDETLLESLQAQEWFNAEDFSKGLAVARTRHPRQPDKAEPLQEIAPPSKSIAGVEPLKTTRKPAPGRSKIRFAHRTLARTIYVTLARSHQTATGTFTCRDDGHLRIFASYFRGLPQRHGTDKTTHRQRQNRSKKGRFQDANSLHQ